MTDIANMAMCFASVRSALRAGGDPVAIVAESCRRARISKSGVFTALAVSYTHLTLPTKA